MGLPLSKRDYDIFLSHAHADRTFVSGLDGWLSRKAGFSVWYDNRELSAGAALATDLQAAIQRCRGTVLVATKHALDRGWVRAEYNAAMDERANYPGFRVVALRLGEADVSSLMRGVTWIDAPEDGLDRETALGLVRAFYPGEKRPNPERARDVYVSCSWRSGDSASARAVCLHLASQGFRLIGDARDQKGFGAGDRVERIMASCGAFVGILPFREAKAASASDGPYKYFLREIDLAAGLGLPTVVVADPRLTREDGPDAGWLRMDTEAEACTDPVEGDLEDLWDRWREPSEPHYIFFAADLDSDAAATASAVRHLVQRVTGMPTIIGTEIHEEPLHSAILDRIRGALLVVADITNDNLNTCIEAGMGLAARVNVEILARGEPRRPPFMLRSLQLSHYADEVEQVGIVHRVVRPYRRRVINAEL